MSSAEHFFSYLHVETNADIQEDIFLNLAEKQKVLNQII